VAFASFLPVVCVGSSDDARLGCDTLFGWTVLRSGYFAIVIQSTKRTTRIITPRRMNWMLP
jgi:hypothetical protein